MWMSLNTHAYKGIVRLVIIYGSDEGRCESTTSTEDVIK